jgi:hypothetical protein
MKKFVVIGTLLVTTAAASAQDAIPALRGMWKGTGKVLLYGTTEHLSGSPQNAVVRDLQVTHTVEGQDGRLLWGTISSTMTAKNRSRGHSRPTTRPSWALTLMAIIGSQSCRPTG